MILVMRSSCASQLPNRNPRWILKCVRRGFLLFSESHESQIETGIAWMLIATDLYYQCFQLMSPLYGRTHKKIHRKKIMTTTQVRKDTTALKHVKTKRLFELVKSAECTPVLAVEWPKLVTPDMSGEYPGKYGKFSVSFIVNPDDETGKAFIAKLEAAHAVCEKAVRQWASATGNKVEVYRGFELRDQTRGKGEDKKPTGLKVLYFKQDAAREKDDVVLPTPILVTDSAGNKLGATTLNRISNGSKMRAAFEAYPYLVSGIGGMSLRIRKLQLVELVEYGQDIDDAEYFDEEVTGFVLSKNDADAESDGEYDNDDDDTNGDF